MRRRAGVILWIIYIFVATCSAWGQNAVGLVKHGQEFSSAHIEPVHMDSKPGIAVIFEGTKDLHYYAKPETAPVPGLELKVEAKSDIFSFGESIFPKWKSFQEPAGKKIEVYAGNFTVFVPFSDELAAETTEIEKGDVEVRISGVACTSNVCLAPFEKTLRTTIDISLAKSWQNLNGFESAIENQEVKASSYSVQFALLLAFLAGLSLNIMPCIWPVLPIIVMRIVEQAAQSKARAASFGLAFCLGILLFFACLAGANIVLQVFYGTVLQWGDQFRSPAFLAVMALLLVVLALFMFGLFTITVPSSIAAKSSSGKGYTGAVAMGFLAAILSTPCSFAILAAAFAWAQAQPLHLATIAIMVMGIGMALPYAILTSMPGLLKCLPKAGRWMELFKQAIGFILLIIAVKLIAALPQIQRINVLYFAVVLAFSIWMWSTWVSYNTRAFRKWMVRVIAVALAVAAGWVFLAGPKNELIDWQDYNADLIGEAIAQDRPVLIKFTADWCLSCQTVEKVVYSRKNISQLIEQKNVLAIKADTTERNLPATLALKNIYNEPGVPVSMLFVPGKEEPLRWHGILFASELKKTLQQITPVSAGVNLSPRKQEAEKKDGKKAED